MASALIFVLLLLALILCGFVLPVLMSVAKTDAARQQQNGVLRQGFLVRNRAVVAEAACGLENRSAGIDGGGRKDRAQCYLQRIVALTGARQVGSGYALDIGNTRFQVRDRYVRRLRDVTDPKCLREETCFYSEQRDMPKEEQIASALLQIRNNPALFDQWAAQKGAFKADGRRFSPKQ